MAEFDPLLPPVNAPPAGAPTYKGNTSLGGLFEDLGSLFEKGVKGANEVMKGFIRNEATEGIDQVRDRELNRGAQLLGYNQGQPIPKDISSSLDRLQVMRDAKDSGQIGGSHYDMMLDGVARSLRSRYPGHREYIDNTIQDLTGTTPANRAIQHLHSELNKDPENAARNHEINWAMNPEHGGPLRDALISGVPVSNISLAQMRQWNASRSTVISQRLEMTHSLDLSKKNLEVNLELNTQRARETVFAANDLAIRGKADLAGSTWSQINDLYKKKQEAITAGNLPDPKQEATMDSLIARFKDEQMKEAQDFFTKPVSDPAGGTSFTWQSVVGHKGYTEIMTDLKAKMDRETDFKNFKYTAGLVDAKKNDAIARLINSSDYILRLSAYEKLIGPQLTNSAANYTGEAITQTQNTFVDYVVKGLGLRQPMTKLLDDTQKEMKAAKESDQSIATVKRVAMDKVTKMLADPNANDKERAAIVETLFGDDPQTKDFYATASKAAKEKLFSQLLTPEITNAVFATNNPSAINKYRQWSNTAVSMRYMEAAAELKTLQQNPNPMWNVEYNPKDLTFKAVPKPPPTDLVPAQRGMYQNTINNDTDRIRAQNVAFHMNKTTAYYRPIADKLGLKTENINEAIQRSLIAGGVDPAKLGVPR